MEQSHVGSIVATATMEPAELKWSRPAAEPEDDMKKYTAEVTFLVPEYRHVTIEVPDDADLSPEDICQMAIEADGTNESRLDYETASPTYITGMWVGEEAYRGDVFEIPAEYERSTTIRQWGGIDGDDCEHGKSRFYAEAPTPTYVKA